MGVEKLQNIITSAFRTSGVNLQPDLVKIFYNKSDEMTYSVDQVLTSLPELSDKGDIKFTLNVDEMEINSYK